jgi:hypothetical protein
MTSRGRASGGAAGLGIAAALLVIAAIALLLGSISRHSAAARTTRVQSHGIQAAGSVLSAKTSHKTSKSTLNGVTHSTVTYTSKVTVAISSGALEGQTTFVHYRGGTRYTGGSEVGDVLVDPQDHRYSEFARYPYEKSGRWVVLALIGGLLAALAGLLGYGFISQLKGQGQNSSGTAV